MACRKGCEHQLFAGTSSKSRIKNEPMSFTLQIPQLLLQPTKSERTTVNKVSSDLYTPKSQNPIQINYLLTIYCSLLQIEPSEDILVVTTGEQGVGRFATGLWGLETRDAELGPDVSSAQVKLLDIEGYLHWV